MAEPYRGRGGQAPPKEYGAERDEAGWVKMTHPTLPDNKPIKVIEAAIPAKMNAGWELAEDFVIEVPATDEGSTWDVTDDEELTAGDD